MMKKLLFGCALLLAFGVTAGSLWLQTPRIQDREFLSELHADALREREFLHSEALTGQENGFLHPELVSLWQTPPEQLPPPLKSWLESSSVRAGERRPPMTKNDYDSAQSYLNALQAAFQKPYFVATGENVQSFEMNIGVLKECCFALTGEMEYFAAKGDYDKMFLPMVSIFKVGNRLRDTPSATNAAMGTLFSQYAVETAMIAIPPKNEMTADDLRILATYVGSYLPPDESELDDILRREYGQTSLALHEMQEAESSLLQAREIRKYDNAIIDLLKTGATTDDALVANFQALRRSSEFYRRRQQAFGVLLGVQSYQARFGELPATIEQLAAADVDYPDPSEQERIGLKYQAGQVTVELPEITENDLELWNRSEPAKTGWYEVSGKQLTFPKP